MSKPMHDINDYLKDFNQYDALQRTARQSIIKAIVPEVKTSTISPIETDFYAEWCKQFPSIKLLCQYHIDRYRVDFAHPESMTVIELDGHQYHNSKRDRTYDAQRARVIQLLGWRIWRFTGTEVHLDVENCVLQVWEIIQGR